MSGGAYNYFCWSDAGDILNFEPEILSLVTSLESNPSVKNSNKAKQAAQDTLNLLLDAKEFLVKQQAKIDKLRQVWINAEWLDSGDTSIESLDEALADYGE